MNPELDTNFEFSSPRQAIEDTGARLFASAYGAAKTVGEYIPAVQGVLPEVFRAAEQILIEPLRLLKGDEKGKHIGEDVSEAEVKTLEHLGKSREELIELKKEINQKGRNPNEHAIDLMKNHRVLGLGEMHTSPNPMRDFGKSIIADLKKAGATHLALEIPIDVQGELDNFMKTGKIDKTKLPALLRDDDFMGILDEARKAELKIVCVDARHRDDRFSGSYVNRDKHMADGINDILDADENNKVVFWVGSLHLSRKYGDHKTAKSAADYIKEKHSMATVLGETDSSSFSPLITLTQELKQSVSLNMKDASKVADTRESYLKDPTFNIRYQHWDNVIVFPSRKK